MTFIAPALTGYLVFVSLLVGSFVNLAADRVPRGESIIRPRSHCRACGRQLNTIDLLPVLGYLLRRGCCASCGVVIGVSSPIVEAVSGGCMLLPILWLGLWPGAAAGIGLVAGWSLGVTGLAVRRRATAGGAG